MSGTPDHGGRKLRPYLVEKTDDGDYRLTVRVTRYNSQNYPIVSQEVVEERFRTATAARAFAKQQYGAVPGEFAAK